MTGAASAAAFGHARSAMTAVGALALVADHVGAKMSIPRELRHSRTARDQLVAIATCIAVVTDELGAHLEGIEREGRQSVGVARVALRVIGTLAGVADRVGTAMSIPRVLRQERAAREQLISIASSMAHLADVLGAHLDAIEREVRVGD